MKVQININDLIKPITDVLQKCTNPETKVKILNAVIARLQTEKDKIVMEQATSETKKDCQTAFDRLFGDAFRKYEEACREVNKH